MDFFFPDQNDLHVRRLDSFPLSTRALNCLRDAHLGTVGSLILIQSSDFLRLPNAGVKTLAELRSLLAGLGLGFLGEFPLAQTIDKSADEEPRLASFLEVELRQALELVCKERNIEILSKLWGWDGAPPRTLDSVGKEFSLTRERVRQIEERATRRLASLQPPLPLVMKATKFIALSVPARLANISEGLRDSKLSKVLFDVDGLALATKLFRKDWRFERVAIGNVALLCHIGESKKYRNAVLALRRRTSQNGCTSFAGLAADAEIPAAQLEKLKCIFLALPEVEWLDDEKDWLLSNEPARNRLANISSKVLSVAPQLQLSELRRALSRSRRLSVCPPGRVIARFVEYFKLGSVVNSVVFANPACALEVGSATIEGVMLRVLDENSGVMDGEAFAEKCIESGVNAISFYQYRHGSPLICPLGSGVFAKVGIVPPIGLLEQIVARRRSATRSSEYGWLPNGTLWFGFELTRLVITAGGVRLPRFVADLVQGAWDLKLADQTNFGRAKCSEIFISSLSKAFLALGAEPSDLAVLEFDLKNRILQLRVGGPGLIDSLGDDLGQSPDEDC